MDLDAIINAITSAQYRGNGQRVVSHPGSDRRCRTVGPIQSVDHPGIVEASDGPIRMNLLSVGVEKYRYNHKERDAPSCRRHDLSIVYFQKLIRDLNLTKNVQHQLFSKDQSI